ncbi:MAG: PstS family phosphate ABC transporter substrate-binding protein [Rhodospirillales bacterium]
MKKASLAAALVVSVACASAAEARDQIRMVGSSTVFPFSTRVAEEFGKTTNFKTPVVESTGTGGGFKLFCSGIGVDTADFSNASRAIKKSEIDNCVQNGVTEITEVKIGYDGIVFANSKKSPQLNITLEQIFLALAKEVPDGKGGLQANPNTMWNQIDPSLPATKIEVLGPPPTSGTRDAFNELAMEGGCEKIPALAEMKKTDEKKLKAVCQSIREDGVFVEAGENDVLIVRKLEANPAAFGIFGYSFLDQNRDKIQGSKVNGIEDSYENISSGAYPISRSLFVYVKKAHVGVIPGIKEYLAEYTAEKAWGPEGYLADKGLIALPDAERKKFREVALQLPNNVGGK